MVAFDGQVMDLMNWHQAIQLGFDLLNHHGCSAGHDGDSRQLVLVVDLGHRQAGDIIAAAGEEADHPRQNAGLIGHQNGNGVLFDHGNVVRHRITLRRRRQGAKAVGAG